jgi:F-type H+-transporting ATPase subunit a
MLLALLQDHGAGHEGGGHAPPESVFSVTLWKALKDTAFGKWMGFDTADRHLGMYWFDAIGFSIIGAAVLVVLALAATKSYQRVPRGVANLMEWAVSLLRGLVHGFIPGKQGDQYVPYLGSLFLFIFINNLLGLLPAFRAPTMTLSTTLALGITTFVMVQQYAIRATGFVAYAKHFMGEVLWLAPLMVIVEVVGEFAKPMSLALRLYGNIFGEDNVIEQLMGLGIKKYIPVQFPMLCFAIFTSFLQAFIFTTLSTIYIASKVVHEGHGEGHGDHGDGAAHGHGDPAHAAEKHAHGAHH